MDEGLRHRLRQRLDRLNAILGRYQLERASAMVRSVSAAIIL